jgi:prepilin-type N-terminal cleavage/methylation domain-containing protein
MIPHRLRVINWDQKGFTLLELVIAMAITALIGSAVGTATYQVVKVNTLSSNHQIAVSQVQNAVNSISHDAQQAQQVIPQDALGNALLLDTVPVDSTLISFDLSSGEKLMVKWVDWDGNVTNEVTYTIVNGTLRRDIALYVNGSLPEKKTMTIANNISTPDVLQPVHCNWDTYMRTLTFQMQVVVGTTTETRTFQILPRPVQ